MNPRAIKAEAFGDYTLLVTFSNGEVKKFNATNLLGYPVYEPLKNISFFKKVNVENGIIVWDSSIDVDPDLLYLESVPIEAEISK